MTWAWIIVFVGLVPWIALGVMVFATCRHVRTLTPGTCSDAPLVSVICPARNEADEIEAAVRSRLRDPARWLEFILVDDRSTDGTGEILDRLATEDDRIRVIHIDELPDGWLGKVHAQQRGIEIARGDWYLFSDGDVHVDPGLVESALAWANQEDADHVALLPRILRGPQLMRACLPVMMLILLTVLRLWRTNDDHVDRAMGVGAFNLVRREALERAGGMDQLRMEIADDVGLGLIIQESGGRSRLAVAVDRLRVTWYRSTRDFLQGMEKGAAKVGPRPMLLLQSILVLLLSLSALSPFIMLALWSIIPMPTALIALVAAVTGIITTLVSAIRFALPWNWALLVPLGLVAGLFVAQRSLWLAMTRGGVHWKGDLHSLDSAQAGARVRL
ncbi:MAG: glycosyltransferase family 2 protein [Planctomycetota bacterium]|nr:glycosyltransferase family 2 protein [Planctomycetota bacterium]